MRLRQDRRELEGQGLVEYGLIMIMVSIAAVIALGIMGDTVSEVFLTKVIDAFP